MEQHTNRIIANLKNVTEQIELYDNYEFTLDEEIKTELFSHGNKKDKYSKHIRVVFDGQEVYLTHKEIEVLHALKYSISNKGLATYLGISTSTLEKHIHKLKTKLNIFTKEGLLNFSSSSNTLKILEKGLEL